MLKRVVVILVLGLAIGLWLGFNPQTREKTAMVWENTKTLLVTMKAQVSMAARDWMVQLKSSVQSGAKRVSLAWKQTSIVFISLWASVRHIWLRLTTGIA